MERRTTRVQVQATARRGKTVGMSTLEEESPKDGSVKKPEMLMKISILQQKTVGENVNRGSRQILKHNTDLLLSCDTSRMMSNSASTTPHKY